jgi:hypothetical protein
VVGIYLSDRLGDIQAETTAISIDLEGHMSACCQFFTAILAGWHGSGPVYPRRGPLAQLRPSRVANSVFESPAGSTVSPSQCDVVLETWLRFSRTALGAQPHLVSCSAGKLTCSP